LREMPVKVLLDGGSDAPDQVHRRIVGLARESGTRIVAAHSGQVLQVAGLRLRLLSPETPFDPSGAEPNDQAVVLLASYRGFDALLPADAESNVTLPLALRPVEVLKVAHHGSEDEGLSALLERLRPRVAVIQVGASNRYGHPRAETLSALASAGSRLWRTDRDGDVSVSAGPSGPVVETEH
jgi:competence protein ComEC